MATCKDCLHVEVCKFKDLPAPLSDSYIRESECIEKRCGDFKDRSKFVGLPAKSEGIVLSFPWDKVDREVIEMLGLTDFVRDHTDRGKAVRYDQKKEDEK